MDLRTRVVDTWEANEGSQAAIAKRFYVSPSSVERWIKLKRETGSLQPRPRLGSQHSRKLIKEHQAALKKWNIPLRDLTLKELAQRLYDGFSVQIEISQISRTLSKIGWTRKKALLILAGSERMSRDVDWPGQW
ncbi:helix-turn-helix domain-containing protein [Bradymonas sediminis]|uniref:helix-turn-helix domain-containing protein n=1 Tax=Bradymonas sediminis TaxID=1548548 RepID=UPI003B8496C3